MGGMPVGEQLVGRAGEAMGGAAGGGGANLDGERGGRGVAVWTVRG